MSAERLPDEPDGDSITIDRATVAHWAEVLAFALDNEPERIDALLELAAEVEEVAGVAA